MLNGDELSERMKENPAQPLKNIIELYILGSKQNKYMKT
jgi:hypothetical protein